MARAVHELVAELRIEGASQAKDDVDDAADAVESFGSRAESVADDVESAWQDFEDRFKGVAKGLSAAGGAAELFARQGQGTEQRLAELSILTGETTDDVQDLISTLTEGDPTFSPQDAMDGMMELQRRGVDTTEQFEELLPVFDTFADATGKGMAESVELFDKVLSPLGGSLEDAGDELDILTHIAQTTDVNLGTLERNLARVPNELQDLGIGADDVAAGLAAMSDQGFDGRESVREFRRAVADSDGDMSTLLDNLNLSESEFADYQGQVGESAGLTDELAGAVGDSFTPLQHLQSRVQDLAFRYSGLSEAAGIISPVLMTAWPAMEIGSKVISGLRMAVSGLGRAFTFLMANPVVLVIAGIAALVAGIYLLWRNWDTVTEWISNAFERFLEFMREHFGFIMDPIDDLVTRFQAWRDDNSDILSSIREAIGTVFGWIRTAFGWLLWPVRMIISAFQRLGDHSDTIFGALRTVVGLAVSFISFQFRLLTAPIRFAWRLIRILYDNWDEILDTLRTAVDTVLTFIGDMFSWLTDPIMAVIDTVRDLWENWDEYLEDIREVVDTVVDFIGEKWDGLVETIGDVWDGIVDTIKTGVNAAIGPINSMIDALNGVSITLPTIPEWVPVVGGLGGDTISLPTIPSIPTLNRGGIVPGGGPDRDSVLAALTPGEWVLSRTATRTIGPSTLAAIERWARHGGSGPMHPADMLMGGDHAAPGLLYRNAGGPIATAASFAAGERGKPYLWGGVGPRGYDCSGFTSAVQNVAEGRPPHSRRHTTHSFPGADGWQRNLTSDWMVGVTHAGVGHMSGTIGGLAVESRGSAGVVVGSGARAHDHPLYRERYGHMGLATDSEGVPFWARPLLDAIANAFARSFGMPETGWASGAYVDRPWRGIASVGEKEPEFVTPESQLARVIDERLAASRPGGAPVSVTIQVDGDIIDAQDWWRRNEAHLKRSLAQVVADERVRR